MRVSPSSAISCGISSRWPNISALINACKEHRYLPVFSKRTALRREMYERVASRWSSLGLSGEALGVRAFETDQPVVYHEEGSFGPGNRKRADDSSHTM
jgi:4-hydroxy-3-polyprenylbenzoate decarboxylase